MCKYKLNYIFRWHTMTSIMDENKYSITNSGWIMYETFTENLHTLNKSVPISLFNKCWPILANKFSTVSSYINIIYFVYILYR